MSKFQDIISPSTTKVEYIILSNTIDGIFHLEKLFAKLGISKTKPTPMYSDNQSYIKLIDNLIIHKKTKYIDIKLYFIREKV